MPFKPITHMCVNMYEHKNKEKEKQESIISEWDKKYEIIKWSTSK